MERHGHGGADVVGAAASLAVAAVLVLGATSLTDAAGTAVRSPASSHGTNTSTTPSSSSMPGMPGMSGGTTTGNGSAAGTTSTSTRRSAPMSRGPRRWATAWSWHRSRPGRLRRRSRPRPTRCVAQTTAAVAKYASLSAAAAGYVPATNPNGYEVHYANWQTVRSE